MTSQSSLKKVAVNTAVVYGGKLLGILISTVTLGIIARYLGVEGYGDYSAVLSYVAVVIAIVDLGIGWLATREIALGNVRQLVALRSLKIVATLAGIIGAFALLPLLQYRPNVTMGVLLVGVYTFVTALNSFQVGILQGFSELRRTVYADTAGRIVNLVLAFTIARLDLGIAAQFLALNIVGLVVYFVNAKMIAQTAEVPKGFALKGIRTYQYDLMTLPAVSAVSYLVYRVDILILAKMASAVDTGIYAAAYRIIDVAVAVPSILVGTLLPLFTKVIHESDEDERGKTFTFGFSSTLFVAGLASVCCFVFAEPVVKIVVGSEIAGLSTQTFFGIAITPVRILQVLAGFLYLSFIGSLLSGLLLAAKRQMMMLYVGGFALMVTITGNSILIPRYSYMASALLTVVTELCLVLGMLIVLRKSGWLGYFWGPFVRSLIALFVTLVAAYSLWVTDGSVYLRMLLPVIYCVAALAIGSRERDAVRQLIQKVRGTRGGHV